MSNEHNEKKCVLSPDLLEHEIWKPMDPTISKLHELSDMGRVRQTESKRIEKTPNARVRLEKERKVAVLVATTFVPNPHNYKYIKFLNGDKLDCRASNLKWMRSRDLKEPEEYKYKSSKEREKEREAKGIIKGVWPITNTKGVVIGYSASIGRHEPGETRFSMAQHGTLEAARKKAIEWRQEREIMYGKAPKDKKKAVEKNIDPLGNVLPMYLTWVPGSHAYRVRMNNWEPPQSFLISDYESIEDAHDAAFDYWQKRVEDDLKLTPDDCIHEGKSMITRNPKYMDMNTAWLRWCDTQERAGKRIEMKKADFVKFVLESNCDYCNLVASEMKPNTIDRVNSTIRVYATRYCVSSCLMCNIFKSDRTVASFLGHIRMILLNHGFSKIIPPMGTAKEIIDDILNPLMEGKDMELNDCDDDHDALTRWKIFQRVAHSRDLEFTIDWKQYRELIKRNCFSCDRTAKETSINVDRFRSLLHYTTPNSVPCCYPCNVLKNSYKWEDVLTKCETILRHRGFTLIRNEDAPSNLSMAGSLTAPQMEPICVISNGCSEEYEEHDEKGEAEKWKPVDAKWSTIHEVSTLGNVRKRGKTQPLRNGGKVALGPEKKQKSTDVARLVAECFIPNPEEYIYIGYLNGNEEDCRASNLEWRKTPFNLLKKREERKALGLPTGVTLNTDRNAYRAKITVNGEASWELFSIAKYGSATEAAMAAIMCRRKQECGVRPNVDLKNMDVTPEALHEMYPLLKDQDALIATFKGEGKQKRKRKRRNIKVKGGTTEVARNAKSMQLETIVKPIPQEHTNSKKENKKRKLDETTVLTTRKTKKTKRAVEHQELSQV